MFTACTKKSSNEIKNLSAKTDYKFDLTYDNKNHQLLGTMKATITNYSGDSWKKIVINDWSTTPFYEKKAYLNYACNTTHHLCGRL